MAHIQELCNQAIEFQAPQLITIVGNQGTGKTRLVAEVVKELRRNETPMRVFRGAASPDGGKLHVIISLIRDRFGVTPKDRNDAAARVRFSREVAQVFAAQDTGDILHLLGGLVGLEFQSSRFMKVLRHTRGLDDQMARAVLRRFFEVDAQKSPILLVFDDMQWADDMSLSLLADLAENLAGSPIVIVSCARPEMLVKSPDWGGLGTAGHERIDLRGLGHDDTKTMFRNLLSRCKDIPEDVVEDAVDVTGGNPKFLVELIQLYLEHGAVDTSKPEWTIDVDQAFEIELPVSVEEAIEARIAALSLEQRDVLEKGAVFGNVFWTSAVVSLTRVENAHPLRPGARSRLPQQTPGHDLAYPWADQDGLRKQVTALLDELVAKDYLQQLDAEDSSVPGEPELVFKHNLERELIVKSTEPDRQTRYYRLAAHWLETKLAGRSEEQLEFLAQLYEKGGDPHRASHCYLAGGDMARGRFANREAVDLYTRGLAMLDDNDALARITALHNLGDVLDRVGDTDAALEKFRTMLRMAWLYDDQSKAGAAHGRLGRIYRRLAEYDRAMRHFHEASHRFTQGGDDRGIASTLDDMGQVHWNRGAYAQALEFHRQALAIRRVIGDVRSIALTLANIGRAHHASGSFKAAISQYREALDLRRSIDDRNGVVRSLCDLGHVHGEDGNVQMALDLFAEGYELAVSMGDKKAQADALTGLGASKSALGNQEEAVAHLADAIKLATDLGDRVSLSDGCRTLAEVHLRRGAVQEAYDSAKRGLAIAEGVGSRASVGNAHRVLAQAAFAHGQTPEHVAKAEEHFNRAIGVFAGVKNEVELARVYRAFAEFRERTGNQEDANKLNRRADEIFRRLHGATAV